MDTPRIINSNQAFRQHYNDLQRGDLVIGRISLRPSEEHLLLDLVERGIRLIPAALPQLISKSKAMQSELFNQWMLPRTRAIHDIHQLLDVMPVFVDDKEIVTKLDRKNAGLGIHLWSGIEDIYTHASLNNLPFPFVIQPLEKNIKDIRVIIIGDFIEAYERHNPNNFRNNLHCGGKSQPCKLTHEQKNICRQVMERGKFPYAHIDLMVSAESSYLTEINLRGGIRGAKIKAKEYKKRIEERQEQLAKQL